MKKQVLIFYFLVLFSASGKVQNKNSVNINEVKSEANFFNNEALKTSRLTCNKDSLEKSIKIFEQAIKLDNSVAIFYSNESEILCDLGKFQEAIKVLDRYLYNFQVNFTMELFKGYIFEKIGNIDSANAYYSEVMKHYDQQIEVNPNNIPILTSRAFLFFFTKGVKEAKTEFNRIAKKFPNDPTVKFLREEFDSFDRKTYIDEMVSSCIFHESDKNSHTPTIYYNQ